MLLVPEPSGEVPMSPKAERSNTPLPGAKVLEGIHMPLGFSFGFGGSRRSRLLLRSSFGTFDHLRISYCKAKYNMKHLRERYANLRRSLSSLPSTFKLDSNLWLCLLGGSVPQQFCLPPQGKLLPVLFIFNNLVPRSPYCCQYRERVN